MHPALRRKYTSNQHGSFVHCQDCHLRLIYMPRRRVKQQQEMMKEVKQETQSPRDASMDEASSSAGTDVNADHVSQMQLQMQQLMAQVTLLTQQNMELNQGQQAMAQFMHSMTQSALNASETDFLNQDSSVVFPDYGQQEDYPDYVEVHHLETESP